MMCSQPGGIDFQQTFSKNAAKLFIMAQVSSRVLMRMESNRSISRSAERGPDWQDPRAHMPQALASVLDTVLYEAAALQEA